MVRRNGILKLAKSVKVGVKAREPQNTVASGSRMVTTTYVLFSLHEMVQKTKGKALGWAAKKLNTELRDKNLMGALATDLKVRLAEIAKGHNGVDAKAFLEQLEAHSGDVLQS